jgi:hypothetical protein
VNPDRLQKYNRAAIEWRLEDLADRLREACTDPRCYLSGPMTGLPYFNFPAFEKGAEILRSAGWFVYSPRENDLEKGIAPDPEGRPLARPVPFKNLMRDDLWQVCDSDAVFVLPGWEYSAGAEIEVWVAHRVGVPVYSLLSGREIEAPPVVHHEFSSRIGPVELPVGGSAVADEEPLGSGDETPALSPVEFGPSFRDTFPSDSEARKSLPVTTGVFDYFGAALAAVAAVSKYGNDKHNPGQPLYWSRGKSNDHADAVGRHLIDRGGIDPDSELRHSAQLAWRALALLQVELEEAGEAPISRGSRLEKRRAA